MKKGDTVQVLDDNVEGTIVSIENNTVVVKTLDGFQIAYERPFIGYLETVQGFNNNGIIFNRNNSPFNVIIKNLYRIPFFHCLSIMMLKVQFSYYRYSYIT